MFTLAQQREWRYFAIYTFVFNVVAALGFIGGFLFDFTTDDLLNAFLGKPIELLDQVTPTQSPFYVFIITLAQLPFFMGAVMVVARARLFIPDDRLFMQQGLYACGIGAFATSIPVVMSIITAALFTETAAEARLWLRIYAICVYIYVWLVAVHMLLYGGLHYRLKVFPRWLVLATLAIGSMVLVINFFALNTDLPSFVLTLSLPVMTIEPLIWGIFLYLATTKDPDATTVGG